MNPINIIKLIIKLKTKDTKLGMSTVRDAQAWKEGPNQP